MIKTLTMAAVFAMAAQAAAAWEAVSGDDISPLLIGAQMAYETGETQAWNERRTAYNDGTTHQGRWRVRRGRYCSQFGNNDWACYDVATTGNRIRFTSDEGREWIGTLSRAQ